MSLTKDLSRLLRREEKSYSPEAFVGRVGMPLPVEDWNLEKAVVDGFGACVWVYACVTRLAQAVSSVPWQVLQRVGDKWEPIEGHPIEQLIEYPNPKITRKQLMYFEALHLLLRGNAILRLVADQRGGGREMWPLPPARIQPIPDATEWVSGYLDTTTRETIPAEEIVHSQIPNPENPLWGIAPMKPLADVVAADIDAVKWNRSQLKNQGVPPFALIDPNIVDDEMLKEARNRLKERIAGAINAREALVIGGGATVQQLAQTAIDMDWLEGSKFNVSRICAAYGILPALFSQEAQTYSNLRESRKDLWQNGAVPILDTFEEAFNLRLLNPEERRDLWVHYDLSDIQALRDDLAPRVTALQQAIAAGIPLNAAVTMLDLPVAAVEGGDVPLISASLLRLQDVVKDPEPMPAALQQAQMENL